MFINEYKEWVLEKSHILYYRVGINSENQVMMYTTLLLPFFIILLSFLIFLIPLPFSICTSFPGDVYFPLAIIHNPCK